MNEYITKSEFEEFKENVKEDIKEIKEHMKKIDEKDDKRLEEISLLRETLREVKTLYKATSTDINDIKKELKNKATTEDIKEIKESLKGDSLSLFSRVLQYLFYVIMLLLGAKIGQLL